MLWEQLEKKPRHLEEHRELWEREYGARVGVSTMSRTIRRLGWTLYKQRRWNPPSGTKRPVVSGAGGGSAARPRAACLRGRVRHDKLPFPGRPQLQPSLL